MLANQATQLPATIIVQGDFLCRHAYGSNVSEVLASGRDANRTGDRIRSIVHVHENLREVSLPKQWSSVFFLIFRELRAMATVKAVYNYSYDYEGAKITFKKGEQFQLLSKANRDWWQVRRWREGCAQDIYVPAVYVKEVEVPKKGEDPLYENIAELAKKVKQNGDATAVEDGPQYALPALKPKPKRESSKDKNDSVTSPLHQAHRPKLTKGSSVEASSKTNGFVPKEQPTSAEEPPEPTSPTQQPKRSKSGNESSPPVIITGNTSGPPTQQKPGIKEGWIPTYALPPVSPKLRSKSLNTGDDQAIESSLDRHPRSSSPAQGTGGGKGRVPPPVLPKVKPARPKSMVNTSQEQPEKLGSEPSDLCSTFLQPGVAKHPVMRQEQEKLGDSKLSSEPPRIRKTPSPRTSLDENMLSKRSSGGSLQSNGSLPQDSTSPPATISSLPEGWSEHKTSDGRLYYHNSLTGQSSWTHPLEEPSSTTSTSTPSTPSHQASLLERVAPKGWTKEINTFTSTPIFTNCHTGERWALARDGSGNFYYYNMANSSLTVGELPAIDDVPSQVSRSISEPGNNQEVLYDRLNPLPSGDGEARPHTSSEENPSPKHQPAWPPQPAVSALTSQLELFASSMSNVLKKHGYLTRKKLHDPQGKRVKGSWQKLYVILQESQLFFYTDHKAAKEQPGAKPLSVFPLLQAVVSPYNKEKKKFVFQVSSIFGEQFLLQAETSPLMNDWYSTIQTAINNVNQDFKDHPEKYKSFDQLLMEGDGEQSPRFSSRSSGHKRKESKDFTLDAEFEYDPMDDPEISAADKSVRIRSRLKKLMDKRPKIEALKKSGIIEDPVFGCELAKLWERENNNLPRFLTQFMDHIEQHGLDVVGIYRLSGNAASVQKLRFIVEQDQTINLNDPQWADINIVTGCLKLFLRELPDSVVPMRTFMSFIEAARLGTPAQRQAAIAARVKELPDPNYFTLKSLVRHFKRVVDHGHINKMQSTNMAIVFGPTLMRSPEGDSMGMAALLPVQNGIIELMIKEYNTIFRK